MYIFYPQQKEVLCLLYARLTYLTLIPLYLQKKLSKHDCTMCKFSKLNVTKGHCKKNIDFWRPFQITDISTFYQHFCLLFKKIKNKNKNDAKSSQGVEFPLTDEVEKCLQKVKTQTNAASEQAERVQQKVSKEWKGRKELWDKGSKQFDVKQQSLENRRNLL